MKPLACLGFSLVLAGLTLAAAPTLAQSCQRVTETLDFCSALEEKGGPGSDWAQIYPENLFSYSSPTSNTVQFDIAYVALPDMPVGAEMLKTAILQYQSGTDPIPYKKITELTAEPTRLHDMAGLRVTYLYSFTGTSIGFRYVGDGFLVGDKVLVLSTSGGKMVDMEKQHLQFLEALKVSSL